jgi:hypothetical protein
VAAEYEVNIKLNTGKAETQLKDIESSVAKIGKAEKQSVNTTDRRVASLVKLRSIGDNIRALEKKGLDLSKAKLQVTKAGEAIDKKMFLTANSRMGVAVKELNAQRKITKELERQEKARRRQRTKRAEGVALGAGFPLLFGGGPGAVLGGAAGGLTGSFGAQIALSAIGQQVDKFISSIVNTGKAFGSLSQTLELMRERSLFTSKESEELARQLEKLGDVEGLAELATVELASKIGSEGIKAFQDLETEVDEFDRLVNNLILSLQAFLAGPLAGFLDIVNATLGKQVTQGTIDRLAGSLQDPAAQKRFRAAAKERIGTEIKFTGFGLGGLPKTEEVLKSAPLDLLSELAQEVAAGEFGKSSLTSRKVKVTQKDRDGIKPPKGRAPRESRVPQLQIELGLAERLSVLNGQILEAKKQEDFVRQNTLQKEIALEQQAAKIALIGLEKIPQDEKELKAQEVILETKDKIRSIDFELFEFERKRQELFETTIEDLEHQLEMVEATSQAERDRLKIARELKKLDDAGLSDSQLEQARVVMEQLAVAQEPLNAFIRKTTEDLNNLQQVAVQVSQGIGDAIGNSLVNGLRNLVTGASSAKEVFADLLNSVADILANVAKEMIAQYIAIGVARLFAGIGASGGGGDGLNLDAIEQYSGIGASTPFAEGGFVSSPTRALIGEGGEPEYVIPQSKMKESMARFSAGARGSAVIPGKGNGGSYGGAMGGSGTVVNYNGPTLNFNSEDYVPASAVPGIIDEAAKRGAKAGETRTFASLQNSRSRRSRIGLGS